MKTSTISRSTMRERVQRSRARPAARERDVDPVGCEQRGLGLRPSSALRASSAVVSSARTSFATCPTSRRSSFGQPPSARWRSASADLRPRTATCAASSSSARRRSRETRARPRVRSSSKSAQQLRGVHRPPSLATALWPPGAIGSGQLQVERQPAVVDRRPTRDRPAPRPPRAPRTGRSCCPPPVAGPACREQRLGVGGRSSVVPSRRPTGARSRRPRARPSIVIGPSRPHQTSDSMKASSARLHAARVERRHGPRSPLHAIVGMLGVARLRPRRSPGHELRRRRTCSGNSSSVPPDHPCRVDEQPQDRDPSGRRRGRSLRASARVARRS